MVFKPLKCVCIDWINNPDICMYIVCVYILKEILNRLERSKKYIGPTKHYTWCNGCMTDSRHCKLHLACNVHYIILQYSTVQYNLVQLHCHDMSTSDFYSFTWYPTKSEILIILRNYKIMLTYWIQAFRFIILIPFHWKSGYLTL